MKRGVAAIHARALCHATEDISRVKEAMANAFGDCDLEVHQTEGHHGNPIGILECSLRDSDEISEFFSRLSGDDIRRIVETLDERVDDEGHLFIKLDKQSAYQGEIRVSSGEDVLSARVKIQSFPARRDAAVEAAREYLTGLLGDGRT